MGAIGLQRRANRKRIIETRGETTTLNGDTIKGMWQNAGVITVQRFLREDEWALSAFELRLPYYALDAPYSIVNGMEVTRGNPVWRGVIRNVTTETSDNVVIQVNAIVVLATQ